MKQKDELDLGRLAHVVGYARLGMKVFREERVRAVRRLAGNRYSDQTSRKKTFVNLIQLYVSIISRNLIANNPRVLLTTFNKDTRATAQAMQDWINPELERIDLQATLRRWVLDALCSVGIINTGLATPADTANFAWRLKAGFPFASIVDLDDFVFDLHARTFDNVAFIGHRYRAPLAAIRDSSIYNKKARENLKPSTREPFNTEGDEKIEMIGRGYNGFEQELEDMVDLWQIYCPRYRSIITIPDQSLAGPGYTDRLGDNPPLLEQAYIGPDSGPYRILAYNLIPGNPFPKGPIQDVLDIDEALNIVYRKLVRQAIDSKRIIGAGDNATVERINATNDGSGCMVQNPKEAQELRFGGVDESLFGFMKELINRFSWLSGNLETIGGLAPQANTLGQEELLSKQSNAQVSGMQDVTIRGTAGVVSDLLWYHWHHPTAVQETTYDKIEGASLKRQLHPWNAGPEAEQSQMHMPFEKRASIHRRIAPWESLGIKIDPYSMQTQTPQQRAQALEQIITQIYIPMAQIAKEQGTQFNFQEFMQILGQYRDQPDLQRIFTIVDVPDENEGGGTSGGGDPPQPGGEKTTHIVRHSAGGNSQMARESSVDNMMAGLAGKKNGQPQPQPA